MINKYEVSILILRVVLGISFFIHGIAKFQGGIENTVGWFDSIGLPGFFAYVVALIEVLGGIALIVGLLTRIVSTLIVLLMIGAIFKVNLTMGFLGGYELDIAFLTMALVIAITGSNLYSIDHMLKKMKSN
ncbi:Uncharacterized membrane protein YphA, DoxX/SURF4 family [Gracilibacillus ureilyticus]|uniref:Uncharacterized membrane protein YphA, DoxX/SURF4 family n=1 Tax=Gracilibacillus ureilyticus TaxID=531814 RepID=A0A1H9T9S6_9BACI|nr:DoxX family protein [Gracilibacillus ureilyticus]SER93549.1 Uncharacterized membrane protein YphA, DoxX/SURF4 family [Gracilibacillus ureilyticus]